MRPVQLNDILNVWETARCWQEYDGVSVQVIESGVVDTEWQNMRRSKCTII